MHFPSVVIFGSHVLVRGSRSTNHNLSLLFNVYIHTLGKVPLASVEGSDAEGWGDSPRPARTPRLGKSDDSPNDTETQKALPIHQLFKLAKHFSIRLI